MIEYQSMQVDIQHDLHLVVGQAENAQLQNAPQLGRNESVELIVVEDRKSASASEMNTRAKTSDTNEQN